MSLTSAQKFLWVLAGVAALAFVWLLLWSDYRADRARTDAEPPFFAEFELTDHQGMVQTEEDFAGRWMLVFFGFTNCPDVCPTTLSDISGWLDDLGEEAEVMNVVFITVDPERDTVEAMAEYVGHFHSAIRGWTGEDEEIEAAARSFRASYERVPTEGGNYTMNHTASVFLFDAVGRFVTTIDYHEPREFAVPKIKRALKEIAKPETS